jgi:hypothetical protein
VRNGRLILDEPTDLPDGAEVEVLVIDDELTADERAELHASLDHALEDSDAGRGMDAWQYLERHRAGREDRSAVDLVAFRGELIKGFTDVRRSGGVDDVLEGRRKA